MPSSERRPARAKRLIREYRTAQKAFKKRFYRRKARLRRSFQLARFRHSKTSLELSDLSPLSANSEIESSDTSNSDSDNWGSILGHNWRSIQFDNSPTTSLFEDEDDPIPALFPVGSDSDSESGSSANDHSEGSLVSDVMDFDADDELEDSSDEELGEEHRPAGHYALGKWDRLRRWVFTKILSMYETRYELPRDGLPRGPSYLHHVLTRLKTERQDHFHEPLRVNPSTFDALVSAIEDDPVFMNNSNNSQMPVEEQLAITLYRFGHDGNASGLQAVANWAGVGKGTVALVTRRVMAAILRPEFMKDAVRWPMEEEKEDAKRWVDQHSCHAWRGGWCFVDGTLVPLASRPAWYGESYFDRKNRYSLNFQVCYSKFCRLYLLKCLS